MSVEFKHEFIEKYGLSKWYELQHPVHSDNKNGELEYEKVIFRLLEMFDYECFDYGDNQGIDEEWAKNFLIKFKDVVGKANIEPSSYLGALCGAFDFLKGE